MGFENPAFPSAGGGAGSGVVPGARSQIIIANPGGVISGSGFFNVFNTAGAVGTGYQAVAGAHTSFAAQYPRIENNGSDGGATGVTGLQPAVGSVGLYRGSSSTGQGLSFIMVSGFSPSAGGPGDEQIASGLVDAAHNALNGDPSTEFTDCCIVGANSGSPNLFLIYGRTPFQSVNLGVSKTVDDCLWMLQYVEKPGTNQASITVDYWGPGSFTRQRVANVVTNYLMTPLTYLAPMSCHRYPTGGSALRKPFIADFQLQMPCF